ncbi:Holliday junction resolvase RuvX [Pelagibacteraceae bacterium]|jgi:putative Holliday junction resolvase|nr:Holliday junction resolvase RuvX [Pelagibacteraceae bacterium]MDC0340320.1 Holliday junction resolvase RuvX [Pelagibacteraceae bacterium]MDC0366209.1 Holliday junction resolvase RuvX [Pelagibacteraceae bacterium]
MLDIEDFKKKLDKKSRLMGIDPGRKRIGIAISDENKIVATPYTTIIKNKYSDFIDEIKKIIEDNQIKGIVIGNPINMNGSPSQSSQSAKDLAINLSKDVTENITLWDERLSSQGAFNLSNDLELNSSSKIKKLDENSAQFILQGALDYLTKENT